ncbi:hypothetical protein K502DRAFT_323133 [Neoconidiobolus thromboides FSU 785]|nr:hypothetical protein K502DRAFT_323133 [Neoconidiobolus thromboides FSU 785]
MTEVPCEYEEADLKQPNKQRLVGNSDLKTNGTDPNNMFQISLSCQLDSTTCGNVKQTFETATSYLSNIIKFKSPVTVQASFYSFCRTNGDCATSQITLGQAAAARSVALKDDDGQERLYPQALVKQMKLSPMPRISSFDIIAEFNSDASFWFGSGPLSKNQVDFLLVVSHELVHGLGFASAYSDYFSDGNPQVLTPNPEVGRSSSGQLALTGFYENVFDRYVSILGTGQTFSNYTQQINQFASTKSLYKTSDDLANAFVNSDQYSVGQKLLSIASTANTLGFQLGKEVSTASNGILQLETSLKPFAIGSSISHVSKSAYSNTEEFLMRYELAPGVSLNSEVSSLGTWGSEPYGPGLVAVLSKMGYPTNDNPNPIVKAQNPSGSISLFTQSNSCIILLISTILALWTWIV